MKKQTILLKGVLVASLVMFTIFSSYAEGDKAKKTSSHKLVILVDQLNQLVNVVEEIELTIDTWMTKENYLPIAIVLEEELPIENWMIEDGKIDSSEIDEELVIESWMSDTDYIMESNSDDELEIESWMMK